jgi:hypothetical protein
MKCHFCAEEIRDEAIVCRFCGAERIHGEWRRPATPVARRAVPLARRAMAGAFTYRSAAVMFVLSALFELVCLADEVPLFGAMRSGAVAVIYHAVFVVLFAALGIGLWSGRSWGYPLVFVATAIYTLDRLRFVLDREAMEAQLSRLLGGSREIYDFVDQDALLRLASTTTLIFVACWWGFAVWVRYRRDWFA